MKDPRILVVNPFGIGDVLFSTPLVTAIRERYPKCYIVYICNRRAYEVMRSNPKIDRILVYEKDDFRALWKRSKAECVGKIAGFLAAIRRERFDVAIDLSLGYQYSLLLKMMGVRIRSGFNYRDRGRFLTDKVDIKSFVDKHVIEYYFDLLKPLGIDLGGRKIGPQVFLADDDKKAADRFLKAGGIGADDIMIGIIPGCGASWGADAKYRRWDKLSFARVADTLAEKYRAKVVLFGDAKEAELCEGVRAVMKHKAIMACGKASIGEFLCLASRCALIVTNDGGPLHMSVSLGVKTVSIFGPVDEKAYGPYPPSKDHITVTTSIPCRPCYKNFKYVKCDTQECLKNIMPEDVLEAVDRLMGKQ